MTTQNDSASEKPSSALHKIPRRWYDQDPLLSEVLELLRAYPAELKAQAEQFMQRLEEHLGKETLDSFYEQAKPPRTGQRWYDHDPILFRAIELLRVVPSGIQRQAAQRFLEAMQKQGLNAEQAQKHEALEQRLKESAKEGK
jgi:hypothetical protein